MHGTPFGTGVRTFKDTGWASWRLDPWLLLASVGLLLFSIFALSGATENDVPGSPDYYVVRQSVYGVVGLLLMMGISRIDYSRLQQYRVGIYSGMIAAILLVLAVGGATRGSRRWIDLPFFNFQPSELGKILLILAVAAFVVDRLRKMEERGTTLRVILLALVPALLVIMQPDLGTSMVYIVIALAILFMAGAKWNHFAVIGLTIVTVIVLVLVVMPKMGISPLQDYQSDRLTAFLHPGEVTDSTSYQQNQALIALGSGGQSGRGVEQATQTRLDFLPEHHTDFIFAVIGETYGFIGVAIVLSLYALLIWRGLRILTLSNNTFGALIVGGVVAMLMFQVFINVGMNIGIMPITGIPLPLMSYGGSSVIVTMIAIGLLQSVYAHTKKKSGTSSSEPSKSLRME